MIRCSIILITFNQLSKTKKCLDSLFNQDVLGSNDEVIIIDNNSTDETKEYISKLKDSRIHIYYNSKNEGFSKAVNQGIFYSQGKYVCLLNNDTVVRTGFVNNLIKGLVSDENSGAIGAYSSGMYEPMYLKEESKLDGKVKEIPIIFGFCMLFNRELVNEIGGFDEIYEIGNFEDLDFSERIKKIGKKLFIDGNTFIEHHHHASWTPEQLDLSLKRNYLRFVRKWKYDEQYLKNFTSEKIRYEKITYIYVIKKSCENSEIDTYFNEWLNSDSLADIIVVDNTNFNKKLENVILQIRRTRRITHIRTCNREEMTTQKLYRIGINNSFSVNNILK